MEKISPLWIRSLAPILLEGPTGTGKSYWAVQAHREFCAQRDFVTVHLASICDALFESELFGHKRGAFTGAVKDHIGYCERAHDGILFLDEIGELKMEAQQKLLYLLEERKYVPVGSGHEQNFLGKVIAATNRDLAQLVRQGKFREDLYYRFRVLTVEFAPLHATPERIMPLLEKFLAEFSAFYHTVCPVILPDGQEFLLSYGWPGNIREVKNCALYLVLSQHAQVGRGQLPPWLQGPVGVGDSPSPGLAAALALYEKQYIRQALDDSAGQIEQAAQILAISPPALLAKIEKYGINVAALAPSAVSGGPLAKRSS